MNELIASAAKMTAEDRSDRTQIENLINIRRLVKIDKDSIKDSEKYLYRIETTLKCEEKNWR